MPSTPTSPPDAPPPALVQPHDTSADPDSAPPAPVQPHDASADAWPAPAARLAGDRGTDRYVAANGLRFHLREHGSPRAPAVLLLHGLTGNTWEWDPIAAVLARRFRVIALDQRGHGASAWAPDYEPSAMVDDLVAVTRALGLGELRVVGHSMGGINAWLLATRRPELVSQLAIVDISPASLGGEAADGWATALRAAAQLSYATPEDAVVEWRSATPRARVEELRHYVIHNLARGAEGPWRWRFDAAGLERLPARLHDAAARWSTLHAIGCPTLVIRGEHSEGLTPEAARRMLAEIPGSAMVEIPGGGHDLTVERPTALAQALDRFLASEPGAPATPA